MAERDQHGVLGDHSEAARGRGLPEQAELAFAAFSRTRMPIIITGPREQDYPIVLANEAFLALTGYSADEAIGRNCRFLQGPDTAPDAIDQIRRGLAGEQDFTVELLNYRKDGSTFWNELAISPIRDETGRAIHFFASQKDVGSRYELRATRVELSESEARFRALIEASAQTVWITNPAGELVEDSPSWRAFTGQTEEQWRGHGWLDAIHPDDRDKARQNWNEALASGSPLEGEYRLCHAATQGWRWTAVRAAPLRGSGGKVEGWVVMNTDIQNRKRAEDEQRKLMKEVDHRAKNALAIVQGIVRLTHAGSIETYAEAVQHRVEALALAHSMLSARRWGAVPFLDLIKCELDAHKGARLQLDGPSLKLPPHLVQPLSLVLHELIDNAQRHGALSAPGGTVALRWSREANRRLRLRWTESGGPAPDSRAAPGFGMTMTRSIVERQLRGTLTQEWTADGVEIELLLPLGK